MIEQETRTEFQPLFAQFAEWVKAEVARQIREHEAEQEARVAKRILGTLRTDVDSLLRDGVG